jgi:mono/diheme cytochrome c family protein
MPRVLARAAPLALLAGFLYPGSGLAQEAAKFYEENCSVCHTIGGGEQAGPDLKDSTVRRSRDWVVRFLLDPEGVVRSGDPYAVKLVEVWGGVVMPATDDLTREMAEALVDYIEQQSRGETAQAPAAALPAFTAADRARGLALFMGRARLVNGGPSCAACHALGSNATGGGLLGPDLTAAHTRLGGAAGTTSWLARPPTPVMRALYRRHNLTDDEALALAALFESTAASTTVQASPRRWWLALAGLLGAAAGLVAIGAAWRGRLRSVRRRLTGA